jgi:hypothetical protein
MIDQIIFVRFVFSNFPFFGDLATERFATEIHQQRLGLPSGNLLQFAIENGHQNSEFSNKNMVISCDFP